MNAVPGPRTDEQQLMKLLPNGMPRVSRYDEFLKITGEKDTDETFRNWLLAAYTLMKEPAGSA